MRGFLLIWPTIVSKCTMTRPVARIGWSPTPSVMTNVSDVVCSANIVTRKVDYVLDADIRGFLEP